MVVHRVSTNAMPKGDPARPSAGVSSVFKGREAIKGRRQGYDVPEEARKAPLRSRVSRVGSTTCGGKQGVTGGLVGVVRRSDGGSLSVIRG